MKGIFVLIVNGKVVEYDDYKKIPDNFQHVIKFSPDLPPPPHTEDQHREIEKWNELFLGLVEKEKANRGY